MLSDFWTWMGPASLASMVMAPIHCLFGLHIVRRGVIFIDLAVAQIAALGTILAIIQGHERDSAAGYWTSLCFALVGALVISLSRFKLGRVPHEAIIGIFFVVASAAGILLLEQSPHGSEELREMLAGNILLVDVAQVNTIAMIYSGVLLVTLLLWRPIVSISLREPGAPQGVKAVFFDFVFYSMLAVVVASSVQVAGVLVVFTWLVMPAVAVFFWLSRMKGALGWALPMSVLISLAGLWLSFAKDLPPGATMVVVFGLVVAVSYIARLLTPIRELAPID